MEIPTTLMPDALARGLCRRSGIHDWRASNARAMRAAAAKEGQR
ncbi:MAG: hypothetical protein AAF183_15240 [Pseudomonadota bacterium]